MNATATKLYSPDDPARVTIDTTELPPGAGFVSAAELAGFLGVSLRTIWRMTALGTLPQPVRFNRKFVRWLATDLQAWVNNLSAAGPVDPEAPVQPTGQAPADLIGLKAAAAILGICPRTVHTWLTTGKLTAWRHGGRLAVSKAEVLALAATLANEPAATA